MNSICFTHCINGYFCISIFIIMEHRIKELIKEKGYTQQEFAEKIGMSRVGLSQIINGKPSYPTLEKIAAALDVPMWQLFASPSEVQGTSGSIVCPKCGNTITIKAE